MNHIKKLFTQNQEAKLFVRYVIFAGFATIVDFGLLYSLTEFFNIWYFYSSVFAYFGGMVTNYTLNKYFNFRNLSKKIISQFGLFTIVALIGLVFNQIILYYFVEVVGLW